jgi:hypothetical protein
VVDAEILAANRKIRKPTSEFTAKDVILMPDRLIIVTSAIDENRESKLKIGRL